MRTRQCRRCDTAKHDAYKGMYRLTAVSGSSAPAIRLLGADAPRGTGATPTAQWIAAAALAVIGDEGVLPVRQAKDALRRYALA